MGTGSSSKARGPAAIAELVRSIVPVLGEGPARRLLPVIIVIALAGDAARMESNFLVVCESEAEPLMAIAGTYEERVLRTPGVWRFQSRRILNDIAGSRGLKP